MKFPRTAVLISFCCAVLLLFSAGCGSEAAGDRGRTIGGGGTSATYLVSGDAIANAVTLNTISSTGTLGATNATPYTTGISTPRDVGIAASGRVYVLSSGNGNITPLLVGTDGSLTAMGAAVTDANGAVALTVDPQQRFIAVANQAPTSLSFYSINNTTGALTEFTGSPVPLAILPNAVTVAGNFIYAGSATNLEGFIFNPADSTFTEVAGNPFPAGIAGTSLIDLATGPAAASVIYGADNTGGTVQVYHFDPATGVLGASTAVTAGSGPSALIVDPSFKFLFVLNGLGNNVSVFSIDPATGALTNVAGSPFAVVASPLSFAFDATNNLLFVSNRNNAQIASYTVNMTTGALTSGSTSTVTNPPVSMAIAKP